MSPLQQELSERQVHKVCDDCRLISHTAYRSGSYAYATCNLEPLPLHNSAGYYYPCAACSIPEKFSWIASIEPAKFDSFMQEHEHVAFSLDELKVLLP